MITENITKNIKTNVSDLVNLVFIEGSHNIPLSLGG